VDDETLGDQQPAAGADEGVEDVGSIAIVQKAWAESKEPAAAADQVQ